MHAKVMDYNIKETLLLMLESRVNVIVFKLTRKRPNYTDFNNLLSTFLLDEKESGLVM